MTLLLKCFVVGVALGVGNIRADQIDDYVQRRIKQDNLPGISIAVVKDGKLVKAKGYGFADIELNVPATEHTVYQLASISKTFTAEAIMLLEQAGKLKLDEPISKYYSKSLATWSNVTVRHLVAHTSGIRNFTSLPSYLPNIRKDYHKEEFIELIKDLPLDFEPGTKWSYSNSGYLLLGLIIENVSGQSYSDFISINIFKPLGMETMRLNDQFALITNRATGYDIRSNGLRRAEFVSPTQPLSAGALVGTVLDLMKWDAGVSGEKLLPASVRKQMWEQSRPTGGSKPNYGLGWEVVDHRGHRFVGHSGGIHGSSTFFLRIPEEKLAVTVLINAGANSQTIAYGIAGHFVPGFTLASTKPKTDPDPELTKKIQACLRELADKKDSELITDRFRENFSRSRRRSAALKHDFAEMKSFTYIASDRPEDKEVDQVVGYKMVSSEGERFYSLGITADKKIASLEIEN